MKIPGANTCEWHNVLRIEIKNYSVVISEEHIHYKEENNANTPKFYSIYLNDDTT